MLGFFFSLFFFLVRTHGKGAAEEDALEPGLIYKTDRCPPRTFWHELIPS